MFEKRMRGYRAMGYSVGDLASTGRAEDESTNESDQQGFRHSEDEEFS